MSNTPHYDTGEELSGEPDDAWGELDLEDDPAYPPESIPTETDSFPATFDETDEIMFFESEGNAVATPSGGEAEHHAVKDDFDETDEIQLGPVDDGGAELAPEVGLDDTCAADGSDTTSTQTPTGLLLDSSALSDTQEAFTPSGGGTTPAEELDPTELSEQDLPVSGGTVDTLPTALFIPTFQEEVPAADADLFETAGLDVRHRRKVQPGRSSPGKRRGTGGPGRRETVPMAPGAVEDLIAAESLVLSEPEEASGDSISEHAGLFDQDPPAAFEHVDTDPETPAADAGLFESDAIPIS
ncbi:hypothetical protein ACFL59_14745, partial [Planctomycetota bacterium]